jgi:hypothetical protein
MPRYLLQAAVRYAAAAEPLSLDYISGSRQLTVGEQVRIDGTVWELIEQTGERTFICSTDPPPLGEIFAGDYRTSIYRVDVEELINALGRLRPAEVPAAAAARQALERLLRTGNHREALDDDALRELDKAVRAIQISAGGVLPPSLHELHTQIFRYFNDPQPAH